jgi:hypothetical protein
VKATWKKTYRFWSSRSEPDYEFKCIMIPPNLENTFMMVECYNQIIADQMSERNYFASTCQEDPDRDRKFARRFIDGAGDCHWGRRHSRSHDRGKLCWDGRSGIDVANPGT